MNSAASQLLVLTASFLCATAAMSEGGQFNPNAAIAVRSQGFQP